ncbi:recombinase family protein [Adlercreutzia sp. ZJ473]|uniref:recombinase family protein n=1 Tax=Adlercreutzia sp. ZJ473 TaxID=2722822 RepID=UPI0015523EBA|nr:recombinase family protein [Adlercreutzia sp. ZJ473]
MARSKQGECKVLVYLSAYDWRIKKTLDADRVEANYQKCLKLVGRKPGLKVSAVLRSAGEPYPFDPVFHEFRRLVINRHVDCVAVPSITTFCSNSSLAYQWVRDVMEPLGIRYLDAAERFDLSTCDLSDYLHRVNSKNKRSVKPGGDLVVRRQSVPFGYVYDASIESCMRVDEETAPVVQEIFELAKEDVSLHSVAEKMNGRGYVTPSQRRAQLYGDKAREDRGWTASAIKCIVDNPMYTGSYVLRRVVRRKKDNKIVSSERLPADRQPTVAGHHEPLVSKSLFKEVTETRKKRSEHWPGAAARKEGWSRNGA